MAPVDKLAVEPRSANEAFFDALVRHQIFLLRLSKSTGEKIRELLDATEERIAEKIRDRLRNSSGLSTPEDVRRLNTLLGVIRTTRSKAWEDITEEWVKEVRAVANAEPGVMRGIVVSTSPVTVETVIPAARLLNSIVTSSAFEGRTLRQWAKSLEASDRARIEGAIRVGVVAGEPSDVIARRVVGTVRLAGSDGVTEITRKQAAGLVRTSINFIANEARAAFFEANQDIFEAEQFVATLDSRTSPVCRANDGKLFDIGKGPRPPLHFNCRSVRVPVLLGDALGERPAKPSTQKMLLKEFTEREGIRAASREALPYGKKLMFDAYVRQRVRELTGRVPATVSYGEWLARQSVEFQDEVLGKTRGVLFRKGRLPLDGFVDKHGNRLTLKELVRKHPEAFRAAGLDPSGFD